MAVLIHKLSRSVAITLAMLAAAANLAVAVDSISNPDTINVGLDRPSRLSLNGDWKFRKDPSEIGESEKWFVSGKIAERMIKVPLPWQLAADDLRDYSGTAWYERELSVPSSFAGKRVTLCSYGVDNSAKVWINGQFAGEHEGAQTPFLLDISDLVRLGRNIVTVKVSDPPTGTSFFMDTHSLLGVSGMWRDVWVEVTGKTFISDVFVVPGIDKCQAKARICIAAPPSNSKHNLKLAVTVIGPDGKKLAQSTLITTNAGSQDSFQTKDIIIRIPNAKLWDIDHPNLYKVEAKLIDIQGKHIDIASTDFGMRKLETRNGRVYLNNRVIYLIGGGLDPGPFGGAVDVNWHLPPPYSYPGDEEIKRDIRKTKSLGVNFVRVPLRPIHPRWLYWADRMGLLVMEGGPWTPSEGIKNDNGIKEYKNSWSNIVLRDRNHPSLALWELFNESFGIGVTKFRGISTTLYDHIKSLDPTRFVLDNAGGTCLNELNYINNHGKTDFEDVHSYPSFATFFPEGGEIRYPSTARDLWLGVRWRKQPALVTEFAPAPYMFDVDKVDRKWGGQLPWWLNSKPKTSAMPAQWDIIGFKDRFDNWGMDKVYGDFTKFTKASDWYYFQGLKYQTQLMRMNPELSGYISWLFDSAPHAVGSIDYYKDIKVYGPELKKIWTQDLVIVDEEKHNYWEGERVYASIHVSHFSQKSLKNARVEWQLDGTGVGGTICGITMAPGDVKRVGDVCFEVPKVDSSVSKRLKARLVTPTGTVLSENYELIQVYPLTYRDPAFKNIATYGLDPAPFAVLGYNPTELIPGSKARVAVVSQNHFDDTAKNYLTNGGTVILLACDQPDYWQRAGYPEVSPVDKSLAANNLGLGGKYQGGHSDSYYARKNIGIFNRIPYENPYTWQFAAVWPRRSIAGIKAESCNDVLAGIYGNLFRSVPRDGAGKQWWAEVSATLMQFRCGKGRLIISTFNTILPMLDDPAAAVLTNDLIKYASGNFEPKTEFAIE